MIDANANKSLFKRLNKYSSELASIVEVDSKMTDEWFVQWYTDFFALMKKKWARAHSDQKAQQIVDDMSFLFQEILLHLDKSKVWGEYTILTREEKRQLRVDIVDEPVQISTKKRRPTTDADFLELYKELA